MLAVGVNVHTSSCSPARVPDSWVALRSTEVRIRPKGAASVWVTVCKINEKLYSLDKTWILQNTPLIDPDDGGNGVAIYDCLL